ncbi:MAG: RING finger protein [Cetobacterium sp.]
MSTKKRILIRKILLWILWEQKKIHRDIRNRRTTAETKTTAEDDVILIEPKIEQILVVDSDDEIENPLLICAICNMRQRDVVFNECRHVICCEECSDKCGLKCPMCRTENKTKQKIIFC